MTMGQLSVAGLQLDLRGENNLARIAAEVAAAKRRYPWLDMVVLPEMCAYGPGVAHAEDPDGPAERAFRDMARAQGLWLLPGSLLQREGDRVFNVAPVIDPKGVVVARYRKLFPFRPYEEGVTPGDALCVVPIEGVGRLGVSICYDLWFPEITRSLACLGAEVLLCPSLTNTIDRDVELAMARANAASNQCYVLNVNAGAPLGMGRSIVCGPGGEVMHQASSGFEVFPVALDFDQVARVRRQGWHGLGQPLKSFRDSTVTFPAYGGRTFEELDALGPLTKPASLRHRD
jgi:predicted amidohydrolase